VLLAHHAAAEGDDPRRDDLEVGSGEVEVRTRLPDLGLGYPLDAELGAALLRAQEVQAPLILDAGDLGARELRPEGGDGRRVVRVDRDGDDLWPQVRS
jgi:hypothetical protein